MGVFFTANKKQSFILSFSEDKAIVPLSFSPPARPFFLPASPPYLVISQTLLSDRLPRAFSAMAAGSHLHQAGPRRGVLHLLFLTYPRIAPPHTPAWPPVPRFCTKPNQPKRPQQTHTNEEGTVILALCIRNERTASISVHPPG